jgi:hypothetical protein
LAAVPKYQNNHDGTHQSYCPIEDEVPQVRFLDVTKDQPAKADITEPSTMITMAKARFDSVLSCAVSTCTFICGDAIRVTRLE